MVSYVAFVVMLIILCSVGGRPTGTYLEANAHVHSNKAQSKNYVGFGERPSLVCDKNLTIGMTSALV